MGSRNKSDVVASQQLSMFRFGWVKRQGAEPTVAFEPDLLNYSKRIWYMYVCLITLAAAELLCLRTFAFGNVWSKAFRKWLWHVLQHWDSGQTPCTTAGSVAQHNPGWDVRSGNSAKERGEWKGGDKRRGGRVVGLNPSPSFFCLRVAIFHLKAASLMLWSGWNPRHLLPLPGTLHTLPSCGEHSYDTAPPSSKGDIKFVGQVKQKHLLLILGGEKTHWSSFVVHLMNCDLHSRANLPQRQFTVHSPRH